MPESQAMPKSQETGSSDTSKSRVAFLRHPLLVGAAVAVISAFFASLLIPSITQVTQDRPKELELKRGIIERIAGATGTALLKGRAITRRDLVAAGGQSDQESPTVYRQVLTDWEVDAAAVDGEITTYFGRGNTWRGWKTLHESITKFLELTSVHAPGVRADAQTFFCSELAAYVRGPRQRENLGKYCEDPTILRNEKSFSNQVLPLSRVLEDARDAVTVDIVETPAAGFRHSPWSLG
jgi:hypothetical protein